jgi:hypothetical protein
MNNKNVEDVVVSYWKANDDKYYVQFEYDCGKICVTYQVDEKELNEIKNKYKNCINERKGE